MRRNEKLLTILGLISILTIALIHFSTQWKWSFLMDEIGFKKLMPQTGSILPRFVQEVRSYWSEGRFYPVKYLMNLLKWRFLPRQPNVFHAFDFFFLTISAAIGCLSVFKNRGHFIFAVGLAFLQRPLLDVLALTTIPEPWVMMLFSIGVFFFSKNRTVAYYFFFILCALAKEPAIFVFLALAIIHAARRDRGRLILDFFLFILLLSIAVKAKNAGPYLKDYRLLALSNFEAFGICLIKSTLGLLPVGFLLAIRSDRLKKLRWNDQREIQLLCLLFGIFYLYLACAKNTAGYLIIPSAFAFYLAAISLMVETMDNIAVLRKMAFGALFIITLTFTAYRFHHFSRSINESSEALAGLIGSPITSFILINGVEAVRQGNLFAEEHNSLTRLYNLSDETIAGAQKYRGQVIVFELTGYFSKIPDQLFSRAETALGGWSKTEDKEVYRIFWAAVRDKSPREASKDDRFPNIQ